MELYKKIGEIAQNANSPMTFKELGQMLSLTINERGIASHIRGAYNYFRTNNPELAGKIASVFISIEGNYSHKK